MFGIDFTTLVVGMAIGSSFPWLGKLAWGYVKETAAVKTVLGWFAKKPE